MTYTSAGGFMAFSGENIKILGIVSVYNELLLGKNLLQEYNCTLFKNFATFFHLRISPKQKDVRIHN